MYSSSSYQGNYNPYSAAPSQGFVPVRGYANPNMSLPERPSQVLQQQMNMGYDFTKKFSSDPAKSTAYALDGGTFIMPTSASQPYRKPGDMFRASNYFGDRANDISSLYANNAQIQSIYEAAYNDTRVLQPLSFILKLGKYQNAAGFYDVIKAFLSLTWWCLQGPLEQNKTNLKKKLVGYLNQMGVSAGGINELEFKTFMAGLYKNAAITMGYTRVEVFETSMMNFINSVIGLGVTFDDLLTFLVNLCGLIGSLSVGVTYAILEAFFKILVATRSQKVLDMFHTFMQDLIGLGSNNSSNEMIGALKTTKKIFYDAFKTLQKNINVMDESAYYLTDDGMIMLKTGGFKSIKMPTVEEDAKAMEEGKTIPQIVEGTRDLGQTKIVVD